MRIASGGRTFYDDGYSDGEDDEKQGLDNALSFPKQRLYGRQKELETLKSIYERLGADNSLEKGPPFVIVTGYPGSGKSSLITNFARHLKQESKIGDTSPFFFIAGKYGQRQDQPFSAIVQAFDVFFFQILRDNDPMELAGIRKSIQSVIGEELHALTPFISGLAAFMERDGLNPQDTDIGPQDRAWNQVKYLFLSLLRAISSPETGRRIILFLDNLDLADESSLDLLSIFARDRSLRRVIIVTSIQSIPGSRHSAQAFLRELQKGKSIVALDLTNLTLDDMNQFVGDTLELPPEKTLAISKIIFNQTSGNIFFAMNFMKEMNRKNVLYFSVIAFCWEWNLENATKLEAELPKDMLDIIATRIKEATHIMIRAMTIASYVRSVISLATLRDLMKSDDDSITQEEFDAMLSETIKEGFFQKCKARNSEPYVRFSHDQIQQAAMSLVPSGAERDKLKYFIAFQLKDLWRKPEDNWMLYTAADYMNSLPNEIEDYVDLARLNRTCGEKALEFGAFKPAAHYLQMGLQALEKTEKPWESNYDITLSLLQSNAKSEAFLRNYDFSENLSMQVLKNCRTIEEKKPTYLTISMAKVDQGKVEEGIQILLSALRVYNNFPKRFYLLHALSEIRKVKRYFESHTDDFFLHSPVMEDPKIKSTMELLEAAASRSYFLEDTMIFFLCSLRMIRLSLQYGICGRTAFALSGYAVYLSRFGDQNGAIRMGRLVRQLLTQGDGPRKSGCRAMYVVTTFVETWTNPIEYVLNSLYRAHKLAMEAGDVFTSASTGMGLFRFVFHGGYPVDAVQKYGQELLDEFALLHAPPMLIRLMEEFVLPIEYLLRKGDSCDWDDLSKLDYNPIHGANHLFQFHLTRLMIGFFFGNLEFCHEMADKVAGQNKDDTIHMNLINRIVFSGLTYSRIARKRRNNRRKNISRARQHANRLRKLLYSKGTTPLFLLKLLDADITASCSDSSDDIRANYDTAIVSALETGCIHFAAMGSELAGEYFYNAGKEALAEKYINDAYALYKEWHAFAKVEHLVKQYPTILSEASQESVEFAHLIGEVAIYQRRKSSDLQGLSTSIPTDVPFNTPDLVTADPSFRDDT